MLIRITPEDIIKRCLWNEYKLFVLKDSSEKNIEEIILKNEEITLSENDAYVIGLLKIVETDNLIHRFKQHINEVLKEKSTIEEVEKEKKILISKASIFKDIISYKDRFPIYYKPDLYYQKKIDDLKELINRKLKEMDILETVAIQKKDKKITYIYSAAISKLFKINSEE
jgi:hypothetical protein